MLGRLALQQKRAGDASEPVQPPGFFGQLGQIHQQQAAGAKPAGQSPLPIGNVGGVMSGQQVAIGSLHSIFGQTGAALGASAMPIIGPQLKQYGIDLMKPWRVGYGSDSAAAEHAQISGAMMGPQLEAMGASAKAVLGKVAKHVPFISEDWVKSIPEQGAGLFLAVLAPVVPEIQTVMKAIDPNFMTDFSPIVRATYAMNDGRFDQQLFQSTLEDFNRAYSRGQFRNKYTNKPIPKDVAVNAMSVAAERGLRGAGLTQAASNLATAADALIERSLAPNFGAAMALAEQLGESPVSLPTKSRPSLRPTRRSDAFGRSPGLKFGQVKQADALSDPAHVVRWAEKIDNMARRGMIDKGQLYQAAQVAMQNGVDVATAITAVGMAGRVKKVLGGGSAGAYAANMVANTMQKFQQSGQVQDLAVLWSNTKHRDRVMQAVANNDQREIARLQNIVKQNPHLRQLRNPQTAAMFTRMVVSQNPSAFRGMVGAQMDEAVGKNKELKSFLGDRGALIRYMRTGDARGLSFDSQKMLARNPGLAASALALIEDRAAPPEMPSFAAGAPQVSRIPLSIDPPDRKPDITGNEPEKPMSLQRTPVAPKGSKPKVDLPPPGQKPRNPFARRPSGIGDSPDRRQTDHARPGRLELR